MFSTLLKLFSKPASAGFLLSVCLSSYTRAEEPKAEAGIGFAMQMLADYRGADQYGVEALPVPYFFYRGNFLKVDRNGARGEFVSNDVWEFNLSVDASLSAGDEKNTARTGMSELNSSLEIGPSLNFNLTGDSFDQGWLLRLPVRAVFAVDFSDVEHIGYLFNPRLNWRHPNVGRDWRLSFNTGFLLGSQDYHAYYYDVPVSFSNSERPFYESNTGYSGWSNKLSLYRAVAGWRMAVSIRYDNLSDATFVDSPLVKEQDYVSVSFGVAKRLWEGF